MTLSIPVGNEPEDIQVPERVRSMLRRSIRSSTAVILVGPPGTGKTALLREAISMFAADAVFTDTVGGRVGALWSTPDESWSARELVGGETVLEGEICFAPGCVLRAIADNRWLILDETNRADMDRIFGGLLTWLSGGTIEIGRASAAEGAPTIELGWVDTKDCKTIGINEGRLEGVDGKVKYLAGTGWRLLGTYNALDAQRVFRFGAALGRRFARVPIPAAVPEVFTEILGSRIGLVPEATRTRIVGLYTAHHINPLTQLGPAVFLAVGRYVAAALGETQVATENVLLAAEAPARADEAVAEGYVVSVGTWLAHLEPKDRDELRSRTIKNGALSEADWTWILSMIQSLA